jgi:hypothetical protein
VCVCVCVCAGMSLSEDTKMAEVPVPGYRKYRTQKIASLKSERNAIMTKYPEAASVIQRVCKFLRDIE